MALDYGLRLRPAEEPDNRIVIVGLDDADIQNLGTYPIPDDKLAALLHQINSYQPRAIGLDIFRDFPVEPGHQQFVKTLAEIPNVIAIEKALSIAQAGFTIKPPLSLSDNQIGFADVVLDPDGALRRSLLGAHNPENDYRFSFTLKLSEVYLEKQKISLENGIQDPEAMRFDLTELTRFRPNTGAYVRADAGGNQIVLNYRSGPKPFRTVSITDIHTRKFDPQWFRDRIVLIGITAESQGDFINTAAIDSATSNRIPGVEAQAHAISQIISAVLNNRPLLTTWPDIFEYIWIVGWGLLGLLIGRLIKSPGINVLIILMLGSGLIAFSYVGLLVGVWITLVPTLVALGLNGLVLYGFSVYDRSLKERIADQQQVIERTFDTIHNGPLQTLASMLRQTKDREWSTTELQKRLNQLNKELRDIYETVRQETLEQGRQYFTICDRNLNLQAPLHEVLYEVYNHTLQRDLPGFEELQLKLVDFAPLECPHLSLENKRDLCRFFEEALCNVGKHALAPTRLSITCKQQGDHNIIRVVDNGNAADMTSEKISYLTENRGTQQAQRLSKQLGGQFHRDLAIMNQTCCELTWPVGKAHFWQLWFASKAKH